MRALTRLAGALVAALVVAACGSSGSGDAASTTTAAPASARAASPCRSAANAAPTRVPGAPLDTVLRVPASARGHRAPLVVALHFASGTGSEMEQATRLTPEARRDGFVVAYPSASENHFWSADGDFDKLVRTLDAIERVACVDTSRVYAVGISNGGYMSTVLACRAADRIAAVTLFAPGINGIGECSPKRPLSVLEIHGTADRAVPYHGVPPDYRGSVRRYLNQWVRLDRCGPKSSVQHTAKDPPTILRVWSGCERGTLVAHIERYGRGHEWPGGFGQPGMSAARAVWAFFRMLRSD